jgi:hypothetical protein
VADNLTTQSATPATIPASTKVACRDVTYSGDASSFIAPVGLVVFGGSDDAKTATDIDPRGGDVAHDGVNAGNPLQVGAEAIAHGTNPTAVAAADRTKVYANRAGIPFVIGGHPNVVCAVYNTTAAQTDDNVLAAISAGTKYVVTRVTVTLDEACTVGVAVRLGFGATTVPALGASAADAVAGILAYHPGMVPGSGFQMGDGSGILGVGGDGEELRITNEVPTGGTLGVSVSYYTIES